MIISLILIACSIALILIYFKKEEKKMTPIYIVGDTAVYDSVEVFLKLEDAVNHFKYLAEIDTIYDKHRDDDGNLRLIYAESINGVKHEFVIYCIKAYVKR